MDASASPGIGPVAKPRSVHSLYVPAAMGVIALPVGIGAEQFTDDMLVAITIASLSALLLVSVLQMLGLLGGR